ncbi:YwiB family protein [Paenibacillus sp. BAC0078]
MTEDQQGKYGVSITLESVQGGERNIVQAAGEVIDKGNLLYIRYEEIERGPKGEDVSVRTTLKLSDSGLKLMRHGGIQSEQSFERGQRLPGFYRSPYTQFNLSTDTRKLDIKRDGRSLTVSWEYDLYVYEELTGQFAISLHIQEETQL